MLENNYKIIAVTETWLAPEFPSNLIHMPGYELIRADRPSRGGGVCLYVHCSLKYKMINIDYVNTEHLEQLWVSININKIKTSIGVLYRPPHSPINCLNELENVLTNICMDCQDIILMGDLNIDFNNQVASSYRQVNNILKCFNLIQVINEPTRISETSNTTIDIICLSNHKTLNKAGTQDMLNLTDHLLTYCELNYEINAQQPNIVTYRDYSLFNANEFSSDANLINWNYVDNLSSLDDKVEYLMDAITFLFDIHAPLKTITIRRNYRPYITPTIKQIIRLKDRAYKKYKKSRSITQLQYFKDLRNYLSLAIKNEKTAYIQHQININKNNPSKLWRDFSSWNIHGKPVLEIDPVLQDVNNINNYFIESTQSKDVNIDTLDYFTNHMQDNIMEKNIFSIVTCDKVEEVLFSITSNASGIDNINLKMLKLTIPHCKAALTHIINHSLSQGVVPSKWKKSIVLPVPKVTKAIEMKQLRPINILPTMSKILEKIVKEEITDHLQINNTLPLVQSGFRKYHSTNTALMKITNDITRGMDNSQVTYLILLDFSKAFDVINHNLLLAKLKYYGFNLTLIKWFSNYLENRTQCVKLNNDISEEKGVYAGVPQGSILGPILFTIFTAELPNILRHNWKIHLYADDTQLYKSCTPSEVNDTITELNENLNIISAWSDNNGLKLNASKTVATCVGSKVLLNKTKSNQTVEIVLNDSVINISTEVKNLGIIIDQNLNFENHVMKKLGVCYFKFKSLWRYKYVLPQEIKWQLVNAVILSYMDYGSPVYFSYLTETFKNKIQILQNCCLRFSYIYINKREHITQHYNNMNILKINNRFKLSYATLLYKVITFKVPSYLFQLLVRKSTVHTANLRNAESYLIPLHHTAKFERCFEYISCILINSSKDIFDRPTLNQFRVGYKKYLLSKQSLI